MLIYDYSIVVKRLCVLDFWWKKNSEYRGKRDSFGCGEDAESDVSQPSEAW